MENIEYATEEELEIFYKLQNTLLDRRQKEEKLAKQLSENVKEEKIEAKMRECFKKHKDISIKLEEYILKIEDTKEQMKQLNQERDILVNEDFELIKEIAMLCPNHNADNTCVPSPFDICVCSKHWKQYRKYH